MRGAPDLLSSAPLDFFGHEMCFSTKNSIRLNLLDAARFIKTAAIEQETEITEQKTMKN